MRSGPVVSNGAGGRTRTGTAVRPTDFKSVVSAIPPHPQQMYYTGRGFCFQEESTIITISFPGKTWADT